MTILVLAKEDELSEAKEWTRLFYLNTSICGKQEVEYTVYKDEDMDTLRSKHITQEQPYFIVKNSYYWVFVNKDIVGKIGLSYLYYTPYLSKRSLVDNEFYICDAYTVLFLDIDEERKYLSKSPNLMHVMVLSTLENIKYIYFSICNHSSIVYSFSVLTNGVLITYFPGCVEFMEWGIDVYCADLTSESYYVLEDPEVALDFDSRSYLPEFILFEHGIEVGNEAYFSDKGNPEDDRIPPKILEELKK